jgi:hypothetical protein
MTFFSWHLSPSVSITMIDNLPGVCQAGSKRLLPGRPMPPGAPAIAPKIAGGSLIPGP